MDKRMKFSFKMCIFHRCKMRAEAVIGATEDEQLRLCCEEQADMEIVILEEETPAC